MGLCSWSKKCDIIFRHIYCDFFPSGGCWMSDDKVDRSRRRFLTAATSVIGGVGVAYAAAPFIASWFPSAKAQALGAPVKVDISKLEPGAQLTVEWRGQPVWVVRRAKAVIDRLSSIDGMLRDPTLNIDQQPPYAKNEYRSIKAEYLGLSRDLYPFGLRAYLQTRSG